LTNIAAATYRRAALTVRSFLYRLEHFFIGRNIDHIVDHTNCAVLIVRIHLSREERDQEAVVRARSLRQSLARSLKNDE
jgi:hypothetical protein